MLPPRLPRPRAVARCIPVAPGITATTFVDTTVVNDRTYYYVVSASNGLGESDDSSEASARPRAPADLVVSALANPSWVVEMEAIAEQVRAEEALDGEAVRTGETSGLHSRDPDDPYWERYMRGLFDLTRLSGDDVAQMIPGRNPKRMLDLAGGHADRSFKLPNPFYFIE